MNEVAKYDELPADYQNLVDRAIDESVWVVNFMSASIINAFLFCVKLNPLIRQSTTLMRCKK